MILKITKKWRISHDEHSWIIQERKFKQKPPNDWVNKFFLADLESVFKTLVDLGVQDKDLTDFRGILDRQLEIKRVLGHAIQKIAEEKGCNPPQIERLKKQKKRRKK